jgi:hypothetical protein
MTSLSIVVEAMRGTAAATSLRAVAYTAQQPINYGLQSNVLTSVKASHNTWITTVQINQLKGKYLYVELYAETLDLDRFKVQYLIGGARHQIALLRQATSPVAMMLHDFEGNLQAKCKIQFLRTVQSPNNPYEPSQAEVDDLIADMHLQDQFTPSVAAPSGPSPVVNVAALSKHLQLRSQEALDTLRRLGVHVEADDVISSYSTPYGSMPALAYVIAGTNWDVRQNNEALLLHWMTTAGQLRCHQSASNFSHCEHDEQANWINEMLTLWSRALIYSRDFTTSATGAKRPSDQWNSVAAAPPSAIEGFDCEDGAVFVMQLVRTIQRSSFKTPCLQAVQQWLSDYTPVFVVGEIKTSRSAYDNYAGHAYCVLLDSRWLLAKARREEVQSVAAYLPAVVVESTVYAEGYWNQGLLTLDRDTDRDRKYQQADHALNSVLLQNRVVGGNSWRRVCKARAPVRLVNDVKMYGKCTTLLTDDMASFGATECILYNNNTQALSVAAEDLFLYKDNVGVHSLPSLRPTDLQALRSELPLLQLPDPPRQYASVNARAKPLNLASDELFVVCRHIDYVEQQQTHNELTNAVASQSNNGTVRHTVIAVTANTAASVLSWFRA